MVDGALNLNLTDYTVSKIAEKAKAMGIAPEVLAAKVLTDSFADVSFGDPCTDHASNYDLSEEGRPWSDVRPELVARMERKLAEPK